VRERVGERERVAIGQKGLSGLFLCKEFRGGYVNGSSNQDFEDTKFLSWMVVGTNMKVYIGMSLLSINWFAWM